MKDLEYRRCDGCGCSVMDGMAHACREDEYDKLIRRTKLNVSAILAFIVCLIIGFFAFLPAKAQTIEPRIFRPSTPSQVMSIDATARTVTYRMFQPGVGMFTCTTACFINIAPTPLVTILSGMYLAPNIPYTFSVSSGARIGVMTSTGAGQIIIQEMTR